MSQKVTRTCDFKIRVGKRYEECGAEIPNDEPTVFSLDEEPHAADLCDKHRLQLQEALAPFIEAADPAATFGPVVLRALNALRRDATEGDIRRWAQDNGYEVNTFGRVPKELKEAHRLAHQE
jgi:hypothetical protein